MWGVVLVRALYAFAPRGRPSIRCGVPFFEIRPSPRGELSILEVRGFFFSLVCLVFARLYTKVRKFPLVCSASFALGDVRDACSRKVLGTSSRNEMERCVPVVPVPVPVPPSPLNTGTSDFRYCFKQ